MRRIKLFRFLIITIFFIPVFTLLFLSILVANENQIADVVENASKAIVNIRTEEWSKTTRENKKMLLKKILPFEEEEGLFENIGSGVVLDSKGIIVTNEHLISKAINIRVKFINGKEYDAYVLGSDPEYDVALLKINDKVDLPYLKFVPNRKTRVGERTIVIGNPYGLSSSVTMGVISALGRNLRIDNKTYINLIQTDAAVNPGSSGGALLDLEGNLLGIVTAIYGEGKGIGFAIPVEDVMSMLSEFLEAGTRRPILGLFMEKKKGLRGLYLNIQQVIPGSPAEQHGMKVGDHIIELNRKKIKDDIKLHNVLKSTGSTNTVQLKMLRGSKYQTIKFDMQDLEKFIPLPLDERLCGMRVRNIKGYPKLKFKLKEKDGVVLTRIYKGSVGEKSGLHAGDVILKINNNMIRSERDFSMFMIEGLKRNYILYQVKRSEDVFFLPLKFDTLL